jgi:hypothetical protein
MHKEGAVLSALMKMYDIPYDRGHINIMLVLPSCTDSMHILPALSSETFPTSWDGLCNSSNMAVEQDINVKEEGYVVINEEADIGIKQEEISEDITFSDILVKAEPDEVRYVCVQKCQFCL